MDDHLLGYLLKGLEPDEQREVELYLREHPEAHKRLNQLRRSLERLAHDAVDEEPPPYLWVGALARIAEYKCQSLPVAPKPSPSQASPGRSWWRRADLFVAAALLLVVSGLIVSGVARLRLEHQEQACRENLRRFHGALWAYSDNHQGRFPWIRPEPPQHLAGYFVPILYEEGVLPPNVTISCPATGQRPPQTLTLTELEELRKTSPSQFRYVARNLGGCYAYSLGYIEFDNAHPIVVGLTHRMDQELPIMADAPPRGTVDLATAYSPNHGGKGQNVLYIGGHVRFKTSRAAGIRGDDIYLNADRVVRAGRDERDTVLGVSEASPYPNRDW
jgi:hypothetical protein